MKDNQLEKHPHADSILEFARQKANGERAAGWWTWQYQIQSSWRDVVDNLPSFLESDVNTVYRCIKTEKHPQYDKHEEVRAEWVKVKDKGTHALYCFNERCPSRGWFQIFRPLWISSCKYEIREIKVAPKLKLIPWDKVPKGVATNYGEFICADNSRIAKLVGKNSTGFYFDQRLLRLAPEDQQPWIAAECGSLLAKTVGEAIDFLDFKISYLSPTKNCTVVVLKVTGIKEGWTDNPELCK